MGGGDRGKKGWSSSGGEGIQYSIKFHNHMVSAALGLDWEGQRPNGRHTASNLKLMAPSCSWSLVRRHCSQFLANNVLDEGRKRLRLSLGESTTARLSLGEKTAFILLAQLSSILLSFASRHQNLLQQRSPFF
jgi:hypothetical protein